MKPRHIAMGAALVLAACLVIFGDTTPESTLAEPVERVASAPAPATVKPSAATPAGEAPAIARLAPRETLIGDADDRFGQGGAGLFGRRDWTPPPPPPSNEPPPPPPPPVAPPLPFTYVGKSLQDGAYEIYLSRGGRTVFVREGMTIDGVYRVEPIRPPTLTLTYLPLDQVQQINIGAFD